MLFLENVVMCILFGWVVGSKCAHFSSLQCFHIIEMPGGFDQEECYHQTVWMEFLPVRIHVDLSRLCVVWGWGCVVVSPTREYEVVLRGRQNSLSSLSSPCILFSLSPLLFFSSPSSRSLLWVYMRGPGGFEWHQGNEERHHKCFQDFFLV